VAELTAQSGIDCHLAFLDHDEPTLDAWLAAAGPGRVRALALLLASGYHAQFDVPRTLAKARPTVNVTDLGTLGLGRWLYDGLERVVSDAGGSPGSPVVLVAAGSSQLSARDHLKTVCSQWEQRRGAAVLPAAVSGPDPRPADVVSKLDVDARDVVVVPFLLAPGTLADRVRTAALDAGARCAATITTEHDAPPELVTHLVERLAGPG
jgi:sirohydrochlorin ferrochelatase